MSFLLKALNRLDALLAGRATRRVARDMPFGAHPRQRLDIYAPRRSAERRPVLVFFYGGNWDSGDRHDYAFAGRAFAELGFVAVLPDYHHTHEQPYPAFMDDAAAALAWVRAHIREHGGEPDRIVVAGHSAGAPPLLLLTGEEDRTVLPRHSRTLAARLSAAGGEAELVVYPGIDHTGPVKAISRLFRGHAPVLRDIAAFLGRQGLG
jgi:acetyl esterase/lipase